MSSPRNLRGWRDKIAGTQVTAWASALRIQRFTLVDARRIFQGLKCANRCATSNRHAICARPV